jgi:hypothetical protein
MQGRHFSSTGTVLTPTRLSCPDDGLDPVGDLELVEDIGEVIAHRFGTENQALCNLGIVVSLGQQREDLTLALGQFGKGLRGCCCRIYRTMIRLQ